MVSGGLELALMSRDPTTLQYANIPEGRVRVGVDESGRAEAHALSDHPRLWWEAVTPARERLVQAFRISAAPVSWAQLDAVMPGRFAPPDGVSVYQVARVPWAVAEDAARLLGGRLPSEDEWESACRGGTRGLFAFGELPESDEALEPWMGWDTRAGPTNGYGLRCLFTGEWCADVWRLNPADPNTEASGVHVVRGGGAYFWPWQDEEWVWCLSASRNPSSELTDPNWSFRVVKA